MFKGRLSKIAKMRADQLPDNSPNKIQGPKIVAQPSEFFFPHLIHHPAPHSPTQTIATMEALEALRTPPYTLSQDSDHIFIEITCADWVGTPKLAVEGRIFGFHLEPYYLPLVLPGGVIRGQLISTSAEQGYTFRVTLKKQHAGEHFRALEELQPQLLPEDELKQAMEDAEGGKGFFAPPPGDRGEEDEAAKSLLQRALRSQGLTTVNDDDGEAAVDAPQPGPSTGAGSSPRESFGFGFKNMFHGPLIPAGCADTRGVLEVADPEAIAPFEREQRAIAYEEEHWDEGIYMDNYLDLDGELAHCLHYRPCMPFRRTSSTEHEDFTGNDSLCLVLELLFALSYDERTNEGEATVESGWTIAKLSRSLSASTPPYTIFTFLESAVERILVGCIRRALTVPLYRHWALSMACLWDTIYRLEAGENAVRSGLVKVVDRLEEGQDPILSRLAEVWVRPLLTQIPTKADLQELRDCVVEVMKRSGVITKERVGGERWDLEVCERAAKEAYESGEGGFV